MASKRKHGTQLTMIHLAPFLVRGPVSIVGGRRTLIVGLGLALGLGGIAFVPGGPLHGFGCRHCLVDAVPIGSRGYATGGEFAAHLSRADGSSQVLATIRQPFRRSGCWPGLLPGAAAAAVPLCLATKVSCSCWRCPSFFFLYSAYCTSCARCLGCWRCSPCGCWRRLWAVVVGSGSLGLGRVGCGGSIGAVWAKKALRSGIDRIPWTVRACGEKPGGGSHLRRRVQKSLSTEPGQSCAHAHSADLQTCRPWALGRSGPAAWWAGVNFGAPGGADSINRGVSFFSGVLARVHGWCASAVVHDTGGLGPDAPFLHRLPVPCRSPVCLSCIKAKSYNTRPPADASQLRGHYPRAPARCSSFLQARSRSPRFSQGPLPGSATP